MSKISNLENREKNVCIQDGENERDSNPDLRLFSAWPVTAKVLAAREAWTLGLLKWMTVPSSLIMFTSSMPGMLFTEQKNMHIKKI